MNVPDSEILKKVRQWIKYGDEDIQVARHVMKLTGDAPYRLVAYHAQQCAEKYLKAYLVYHRVDFPYTHRILLLLELCPDRDAWIIISKMQRNSHLLRFLLDIRVKMKLLRNQKHEELLISLNLSGKLYVRNYKRKALLSESRFQNQAVTYPHTSYVKTKTHPTKIIRLKQLNIFTIT